MFFKFELKQLLIYPLQVFALPPVPKMFVFKNRFLDRIITDVYLSTTAPIACSTALASVGSTKRAINNDWMTETVASIATMSTCTREWKF